MNHQSAARHGRALAFVLSLLWVPGCQKPDPLNVRLMPGTLAVVVAGETKTVLRGEGRDRPPTLAPGTMLRVGGDPGEFRETRSQFEAAGKAGGLTPAESSAGPRVFPEGHEKARFRAIDVVVESGQYQGMAGNVARLHLSPAP